MTAQEKADALKDALADAMIPVAYAGGTRVAPFRVARVDFGRSTVEADAHVYVRLILEVACVDDPPLVLS